MIILVADYTEEDEPSENDLETSMKNTFFSSAVVCSLFDIHNVWLHVKDVCKGGISVPLELHQDGPPIFIITGPRFVHHRKVKNVISL